jgi:hypothetical protein
MTLRECIALLGENGTYVVFYFLLMPVVALIAGFMGKGEGHLSPWKYFYSTLIYAVCIPGIFAITLSVYLFLFERISIFDSNVYTQILPVISMLGTLFIIRQNVSFDDIPGFGKISGLTMMIASTILIMWFVDKTHIIVFSYLPISTLLFIFLVLLFVIRFGWKTLLSK